MDANLPPLAGQGARMNRRLRVMALAAAWLASAAPLAAREPADPRLPSWQQSHLAEGSMEDRILRAFAYCSVRVRRAEAEALLATTPGSPEERAAAQALALFGQVNDCATRSDIRFRGPPGMVLLRGLAAEFLHNREVPQARRYEPRPEPAAGPDYVPLPRRVAACAVHRAPEQVHAMIRFDHDSPGETRMLRQLRPILLECLPAQVSLPVTRHIMRALLAEALYHFSRGQAGRIASSAP
jgi:hypothetical protein